MNEEMIAKLQKAKTVEEIIAIAKEYGKEVTAEKAQELLDKISSAAGELSDDALSAVAGGGYYRHRQGMVRKPFWQVKCRSTKRGASGFFTSRFPFDVTNVSPAKSEKTVSGVLSFFQEMCIRKFIYLRIYC